MYNRDVTPVDRVKEILSYFDGDVNDIPAFSTLYFEEPDGAGHYGGPFTDNVRVTMV